MTFWQAVTITIHVLAALLWLGGMFFLGVVGAPVLRHVEPLELRQRLFTVLGERFRSVGWTCIAILLVTGTLNLYWRGWLHSAVLTSTEFWQGTAGHLLAIKLLSVCLMLVLSAVHDFLMGPAAGRLSAGSPDAVRARRQASVLARVNVLIGVVLVIAAVQLARG